jgi:3-oxoacyl-[acyl-carrier-protein] synthase-3
MALPPRVVTNDDLSATLDTTDDWIVERTGIRSRRVATGPFVPVNPDAPVSPPGGIGTTATLAIEAGAQAMASAGVGPAEIDLLILCTTTPDQAVPATSAATAAALGLRCGAFDVNAACSGFVYGLVLTSSLLQSGLDRVLLVGSETLSRITDWTDRGTAVLFADGAGAVVVESVPRDRGLLGWDLGADGTLQPILYADLGGSFQMEGREVFRRAVRAVVDSARTAMERAKVTPDDIALFVPHQANARIIEAACSRLGIPVERAALNVDHTGNTSSASVPMALAEARDQGRLADDDLLLLSGFGAGMTFASAIWRWGR